MAKANAGRLYAIGVGPGDPELVTLKAARILSRIPAIFVPRKDEGGRSLALSVINGILTPEQKVIGLTFPMTRDKNRLGEGWAQAAEAVWRHLSSGKDGAFVTLGDPLLYGTAIHLIDALQKRHPRAQVEVVPGVSSISAAAACAGLPLAVNDEKVAVISGHANEGAIRQTLKDFDTIVFLKVHTVFEKLLGILGEMGLLEKAVYVRRCTTGDEEIVRDISQLKGKKLDYFSLLIVRR